MNQPRLLPLLLPRPRISGPEQVIYGVSRLLAELRQNV
jgi:hypothetical protein